MLRRMYATAAGKPLSHALANLHPWPKATKPAPHEIFGIGQNDSYRNDAVRKQVRATYKKYVKLYHPDLAVANEVVGDDGKVLLMEQKRGRFDAVKHAYESLCNPNQPAVMPRYPTGFTERRSAGHGARFDYAFRKARDTRNKTFYNEQFWQAATWEEFYKMKYNREPPTMEQIEENKWKILKWVVAFTAVYAVLQMMIAFERTNEYNRQTRLMNLQANAHLAESYASPPAGGSDLTQLGRIKRFLLHRSLSLTDEERLNTNNEMLIKYAQDSHGHRADDMLALPPLQVFSSGHYTETGNSSYNEYS